MSRFRTTALCALALVTASAVANPVIAGSMTGRVQLRGFGSPAQIPWGSINASWVLSELSAGHPTPQHPVPGYLVLTNQRGQRFLVLRKSGAIANAALLDWSGNGDSALLDAQTNAGKTTLLVVNLKDDVVTHSFVVPTSAAVPFQTAGFTRPDGLAVMVETYTTHAVLTRYSLNGQALGTYPSDVAAVGRLSGAWVYRPDGTELALGGAHGLAFTANDGTTVGRQVLSGSSSCQPQSWWSSTVVLASCAIGPHGELRLFEFDTTGGAPRALTRANVPPDFGDYTGWRVGHQIFVSVLSACGYVYLARLSGATPVMVHVPLVPNGNSVHVVGASSTALAISASVACHGGASLLWYTPSTNSSRVVLGPPVTGGEIGTSVAFPARLS